MKKNYQNILIILICSTIIMLPMIFAKYRVGHDTEFHVANVLSLKEQITSGLSTYIMPNITGKFGYGTRLFYPILSHTMVATISIITSLSVIDSFKLTHIIVLFLSGVSLYYLAKKLSNNNKIALISSIIYMAFPYHISDIYVRDALGECFLFIFIPLIFLGLQYLFEDKRKFYLFFTLGYVGGMLSHFTMMIYFTLLIIPYFIMNYKKIFKKDIIITLIISALTILLITSPSLTNMLEHKFFGNYAVFLDGHMAGGIWWSARDLLDYINIFKHFNTNDIKYYIDLVTLILLSITLINFKKLKDNKYKYIAIFGIVSIYLSTKLFPWDNLPQLFRMIQFPWRLEVFVALSVSIIAPLCLKLENFKKIYYFIIIVGLLICGYLNTNFASDTKLSLKPFPYYIGMGWQKEYLPVNTIANEDYLNYRNYDIISNEGKAEIFLDRTPKLNFTFTGESKVELPRLYYLGYTLKDSLGNKIDIKESAYGFIEADLVTGTYYLDYTGTKAFNISLVVSLITCVIFIVLSFKGVIWKKLVS